MVIYVGIGVEVYNIMPSEISCSDVAVITTKRFNKQMMCLLFLIEPCCYGSVKASAPTGISALGMLLYLVSLQPLLFGLASAL